MKGGDVPKKAVRLNFVVFFDGMYTYMNFFLSNNKIFR